jgi:hypothetical protein
MSDAIIVALVNGAFTMALAVFTWTISRNVQQIHKAVNSERSSMIEEVKSLRDEILHLTKQMLAMKATGRRRRQQRRVEKATQ